VDKLLRSLSFCILLILLISSACLAVSMDAVGGFGGVMKAGVWTPITVRVQNPSGRDVEGVLIVTQGTNDAWTFPTCSVKVSLPANSNKLYFVYVRPRQFGEMQVMLLSNAGNIRQQVKGTIYQQDKLVVSIGDRASRLSFLNGESILAPPDTVNLSNPAVPYASNNGNNASSAQPATISIQVGSVESKELPDRPAAYEGVSVLIVSDLSPLYSDPKAMKALCMWVASGGTLVIPTGPNYKNYDNDFFKELLPVTITGVTSMSNINALFEMGHKAPPSTPMTLVTSVIKPGVCSYAEVNGGVPVFARRDYGAGRVIFFAFDHLSPPFRDWNGQIDFWKGIVSTANSMALVSAELKEDDPNQINQHPYATIDPGLVGVVQENASVSIPYFNIVAGFLLAYVVVLVPVNYFILKKKRKLEMAWVTFLAIVIIFTLGAYLIGYTMKGDSLRLIEATFIEGSSDARYASKVTCARLFSPARRSYGLKVSDTNAIIQTGPLSLQQPPPTMPPAYLSEPSTIEDVSMAMWSSKSFVSKSGVDLGGLISSKLSLSRYKLTGEVTNNTDFNLDDCHVMLGDSITQLPSLRKGQTAQVNLLITPKSPQGYASHLYYNGTNFDGRLHDLAYKSAAKSKDPILVAKISDVNPAFNITRNRVSMQDSVYGAFRLSYSAGSSASVRSDSISERIISSAKAHLLPWPGNNLNGAQMEVSKGGWYIASFEIPVPANASISTLTVKRNLDASAWESKPDQMSSKDCSITIYNNNTVMWDSAAIDSPIHNASSYVSPIGEIKVKVQASETIPDNAYSASIMISAELGRK